MQQVKKKKKKKINLVLKSFFLQRIYVYFIVKIRLK